MIAGLIVASGSSRRMGGVNKLLLPYKGVTVIEVITSLFLKMEDISRLILVTEDEQVAKKVSYHEKLVVCEGGKTRSQSVYEGLQCLSPEDYVLIHDGARPFLEEKDLLRCIETAKTGKAFLLGTPAVDTLKLVRQGQIEKTLARENIFIAQTPQGGWVRDFLKALEQGWEGTDDASLLERLGVAVSLVEGSPGNRKITYKEDQVWLNENR